MEELEGGADLWSGLPPSRNTSTTDKQPEVLRDCQRDDLVAVAALGAAPQLLLRPNAATEVPAPMNGSPDH